MAVVSSNLVGGPSVAKVTLSSAQLLAIFTTPIQVVAAQGAGTVVMPLSAVFVYTFGTTAYTDNGGFLAVGWAGAALAGFSAALITTSSFWTATANRTGFGGQNANSVSNVAGAAINAAVVVGGSSANPTLGNGTVEVIVPYVVVSL